MEVNEFIFLGKEEFEDLYGSKALSYSANRKLRLLTAKKTKRTLTEMPNIPINHYCYSGSPIHQGICGACYAIASADLVAITLGKKKY